MRIEGGIHGDLATTAIVINSIPKVLDATPGLHTMRDMVLPSFFPGARYRVWVIGYLVIDQGRSTFHAVRS